MRGLIDRLNSNIWKLSFTDLEVLGVKRGNRRSWPLCFGFSKRRDSGTKTVRDRRPPRNAMQQLACGRPRRGGGSGVLSRCLIKPLTVMAYGQFSRLRDDEFIKLSAMPPTLASIVLCLQLKRH